MDNRYPPGNPRTSTAARTLYGRAVKNIRPRRWTELRRANTAQLFSVQGVS